MDWLKGKEEDKELIARESEEKDRYDPIVEKKNK